MIFEIELNPKFKISNSSVYVSKNSFLEYCKNNNIKFSKEELEENKKYLVKNLYPDWLLFTSSGWFSRDWIEAFEYIAQSRDKKNIDQHSIKFNSKKFNIYLEKLFHFHQCLKDKEQYKLMWNLEVYIEELIEILIKKDNNKNKEEVRDEIYKENAGGTYSGLHEICVYKKLYVEQSENYLANELVMKRFQESINNNISADEVMKTLQINDNYQDTLFSIIELNKRLYTNKKSETILGAIVQGIVLGVEEYIIEKVGKKGLFPSLKELANNTDKLTILKSKIKKEDSNDLCLCKLENVILKEKDSLEKYLIIYYHARNYLAHNNINMKQFFHGQDDDRLIVGSVVDAVIIIIYLLSSRDINFEALSS